LGNCEAQLTILVSEIRNQTITYAELRKSIDKLIATVDINQRYNQRMCSYWSFGDKCVRIVVGTLAAFSVLAVGQGAGWTWSATLAVTSLIIALALNVVPFQEHEQFYNNVFRRWGRLRRQLEAHKFLISHKIGGEPEIEETEVESKIGADYMVLVNRRFELEVDDPAPWRWVLMRCQHDHTESEWGEGIRTESDVEREQRRRKAAVICPEAAGAPGDLEVE